MHITSMQWREPTHVSPPNRIPNPGMNFAVRFSCSSKYTKAWLRYSPLFSLHSTHHSVFGIIVHFYRGHQ